MEHCTECEKTMMLLRAENAALRKQRAELLEAAKAALKEAEAWIQDQLGGTSSYQPTMDDLQPIRSAITRAAAQIQLNKEAANE